MKLKNLVIFAALILMLSSALTTFLLVRNNESKITELKADLQTKQSLIRDVWNAVSQNENKANIAILLIALADPNNFKSSKVIDYYLSKYKHLTHASNPMEIITAVNKENQDNIDYINTLYLEQVTLQTQINDIERSNKSYTNIAFFLQILSLALIMLEKSTPDHHLSKLS